MVQVAGPGDEFVVRVRVDGSAAIRDTKDMEKKMKKSFGVLSKAAGGALGFFYGGIAKQAAQEFIHIGDMIGRSTPVGRVASEFYAQLGADRTASDRTAAAFGLAGANASRDQILSVFNVFREIERQRAEGRENVLRTIGEKRTDDILIQSLKDLNFTMKNFTTVLKEFGKVLQLR